MVYNIFIINISDIIINIYYIVYNSENIDEFYLNLYIYRIFCIIKKYHKNNYYDMIKKVDIILNELCIYLENIILDNKSKNRIEIKKLEKEYRKLIKRSNKDIEKYINTLKKRHN